MNKLTRHAILGFATLLLLASHGRACDSPYVSISDWLHFVAVGEPVEIEASEVSGTYIWDWWWEHDPTSGFTIQSEFEGTGYSPPPILSSQTLVFSSPGQWRVDAIAENDDYLTDYDYAYVYVIDVDLEGGGGLDVNEVNEISLAMAPSLYFGDVTLTKSRTGDGDVDVFYDAEATDQVSLPKTWNLSRHTLPSTLYVKGKTGSSTAEDTSLTLSYIKSGETVDSEISVFTVSDLRMIITPPSDPFPGYVVVNDDDDDENGIMDKDGGSIEGGDFDLLEFGLDIQGNEPPEGWATLRISRPGDPDAYLAVWADRERNERIFPGEGVFVWEKHWEVGSTRPREWPSTIYVEGCWHSTGYQLTDPLLEWRYYLFGIGGTPVAGDSKWLTVVHLDMDMEGVPDDLASDKPVTGETTPGGFVDVGQTAWLSVDKVWGTTYSHNVILSSSGETSKIQIWTERQGGQQVILPHTYASGELAPKWLYVKGMEASAAFRDVSLAVTCNDLDGGPYTDTINLTVIDAEIDVLSVPDYLFASATYATPIKFKVNGMGDEVYIHALEADLYLNDTFMVTKVLDGRFTAGDGTVRANGTTNTYTCYFPAYIYQPISLGDKHRTDNARFVLRASCCPAGSGPLTVADSSPTDPEAKVGEMFFDGHIYAVEPGIPGVHPAGKREYVKSITEGLQASVDNEGQGGYLHWERGVGMGSGYCDPIPWPVPHEEPVEMEPYGGRAGMQHMWGRSSTGFGDEGDEFCVSGDTGDNQMSVECKLHDDTDWPDDPIWVHDQGCKARYYGLRRGGYFCVSYGGRQLDASILQPGEYAMDLAKTSVMYNSILFETGEVRWSNVATTTSDLNLSGASIASGLMSFIALPASKAASLALDILSLAFASVDEVDFVGSATAGAVEGCLYEAHYRFPPGQETPENPGDCWDYHEEGPGTTGWQSRAIEETQEPASVGYQVVHFVELESDCSAKSKRFDAVEVSQMTEFACESEGDFGTITIQVWDN